MDSVKSRSWRLPSADLVAFSHLQFSQIRGRQPYLFVRKIPYVIALIGVEDLRLAMAGERVLKRLDAECRLHRDRYAPRQHATAEPVEHDSQIDEAARHRDVGDVHRPHLVWPCDFDATQQSGTGRCVRGVALRSPSFYR